MKKLLLIICLAGNYSMMFAQVYPFRFVHTSDTHIGSPTGSAEEDLRRTIADINSMSDISFIVVTGDITELGIDLQLKLAKTDDCMWSWTYEYGRQSIIAGSYRKKVINLWYYSTNKHLKNYKNYRVDLMGICNF